MKPALVIFDCDGVLVDSEIPSNQIMRDNLKRYGLTMSLAECMAEFVGKTDTDVANRARVLGADLPANWTDEIAAETLDLLQNGVDLVPGISDVLNALDKAKVPFCVASNGPIEKMRVTLGQNGLWHRFQGCMFSAHVLGVAKPEPDLFLAAAAAHRADPAACVVIEDSTSGVIAATRAGIRCYGFAPEGDGQALADAGAIVFHHMNALPKLFELTGA